MPQTVEKVLKKCMPKGFTFEADGVKVRVEMDLGKFIKRAAARISRMDTREHDNTAWVCEGCGCPDRCTIECIHHGHTPKKCLVNEKPVAWQLHTTPIKDETDD